jgi:hypothetical protein
MSMTCAHRLRALEGLSRGHGRPFSLWPRYRPSCSCRGPHKAPEGASVEPGKRRLDNLRTGRETSTVATKKRMAHRGVGRSVPKIVRNLLRTGRLLPSVELAESFELPVFARAAQPVLTRAARAAVGPNSTFWRSEHIF